VAIGIVLRWLAPILANKLMKPIAIVAKVMLVGGMIPLLIHVWPAVQAVVDDGTLFAIIGITIIGLGVGHSLRGPLPEDRPVLALATACRHPAVAIAIASNVFPNEKAVGAAVIVNVLVAAVVTVPYVRMSRRALRSDVPSKNQRASDASTPSHHRA